MGYLCILLGIIVHLVKRKNTKTAITEYKISTFYLTHAGAGIYLCFYIFLFFLLRFLVIGKPIDLKQIIKTIYVLLLNIDSLLKLFLLLLFVLSYVVLWLLVFVKLHKRLKKNLLQLHHYYCYPKSGIIALRYYYVWLSFRGKYSFTHLVDLHCKRLFRRIFNKMLTNRFPKVEQFFYSRYRRVMKRIPLGLLIIVLIYDCYYSNFCLEITTYYLPIFLLSRLWISLSIFASLNNEYTSQILYEMYYRDDEIKYVNVPNKEYNRLLDFVKNGLTEEIPFNWNINEWEYMSVTYDIRRYKKMCYQDTIAFVNDETFESTFGFLLEDIITIRGRYYAFDPNDNEAVSEIMETL